MCKCGQIIISIEHTYSIQDFCLFTPRCFVVALRFRVKKSVDYLEFNRQLLGTMFPVQACKFFFIEYLVYFRCYTGYTNM